MTRRGEAEGPVRRPMVSWLSPAVLARSGLEVVLSGLFANFADKREAEAALSDALWRYPAPAGEAPFWLDYASDVGDGFDSTYAVARLLAEPELTVAGEPTRRGEVLVLGGDQVYPSASAQAYEERFRGPYAAALPEQADATGPDLFAVPGNHDWYDGLTSFMRVFCQRARIGGWQTRQARSYFALALPHGWWLWGIDIQFDAYIDAPQLDYFRAAAAQAGPGDRIILATAKPSWLQVDPEHPRPQSWQSLAFLEERVIGPSPADLALTLTGDLHHYARYDEADPATGPKITAGGGGAYLSPTHPLPEELHLPPLEEGPSRPYRLAARWPDRDTSLALRGGVRGLLRPWHTPGLNGLLAGLYGLLALLLARGVKDQATSLAPSLASRDGAALLGDALSAGFVLLVAGLLLALRAWARSGGVRAGVASWALGALHTLAHVGAATAATLVLLELLPAGLAREGFWLGYAAAALVALVGVMVGRVVLVAYLLGAQAGAGAWHANEVFAAQSRGAGTGFKHVLRLRIDAQGVTVFALGLRAVPHRWTEGARPEPADGHGLLERVELVDRVEVPAGRAAGRARD